MLKSGAKVVVVYLLWSNEPYRYLERALLALSKQTYPKDQTEILIIYNAHKSEEQSAFSFIQETVALRLRSGQALPHITMIEQQKNLGFSGGNNFGMKWAIDNGFDYVFLHNGDAYLDSECLEKLVEAMVSEQTIGATQALMRLHPETDLINTSGNHLHYLGFGYCGDYRRKIGEIILPEVKEIAYASGAAVMMRVDLLKQHGLWDEDYFLYHEDTDYSLRLRLLGYKIVLASEAKFFHEYQFSKNSTKYFWLERNRLAILLCHWRWPTLLLLLPIWLLLEIGLWLFAFKSGWWREKFRALCYWLKLSSWRFWLSKRCKIQTKRKISDQDLLKIMSPTIHFAEGGINNPILRYIGNPLMWGYYKLLRFLVRW